MKKYSLILFALLLTAVNCSCGQKTETTKPDSSETTEITSYDETPQTEIDYDLTTMSSTMIYSTVSNMMLYPDVYLNKKIRIRGTFRPFHDEVTGNDYTAVIIPDATACCEQGIEFKLAGEHTFPDDYPQDGDFLTVTGTFITYEENGLTYSQLAEAEMSVDNF